MRSRGRGGTWIHSHKGANLLDLVSLLLLGKKKMHRWEPEVSWKEKWEVESWEQKTDMETGRGLWSQRICLKEMRTESGRVAALESDHWYLNTGISNIPLLSPKVWSVNQELTWLWLTSGQQKSQDFHREPNLIAHQTHRGVFKKWSDFKWKATYKSCILKIVFFKQNKEILRTYSQLIKSETVEEGC